MRISPHAQGSVDWMIARAGVVTASEFDQIVTPEFAIRKGQMPETYLAKKVAEKWLGGPLADFSTFNMDQGEILEQHAVPWYELEFNETIQRVGLITTDDGKVGASPDGLIGEDGGIEIKCPMVHTAIGYLLNGEVPKEYLAQVHGAIYVTGRKWWKFVSYRRRMPALVKVIERDEAIQEKLHEALTLFVARLDRAYKTLCDMNGGPPKRAEIKRAAPSPEPVNVDEVTP